MSFFKVAYDPMNRIHEEEIRLLHKLLDTIRNNGDIQTDFQLFFDDVQNHFAFEEDLMQKYNFFAQIPHKMEHNKIIKELQNIQQTKLHDRKFLEEYFTHHFIPWLENHIQTMDTVTAGFFDMIKAQA
ncbi:MAG: hemerythrin family protein [Epsilonproteobacteria bacterium]|nr:hemerythrin family protein [Campylobacterota bacterium]